MLKLGFWSSILVFCDTIVLFECQLLRFMKPKTWYSCISEPFCEGVVTPLLFPRFSQCIRRKALLFGSRLVGCLRFLWIGLLGPGEHSETIKGITRRRSFTYRHTRLHPQLTYSCSIAMRSSCIHTCLGSFTLSFIEESCSRIHSAPLYRTINLCFASHSLYVMRR